MLEDTDYGARSTEFRTIAGTATADACCNACSSNPQCRYWVRRRSNGECYLKTDQGSAAYALAAGLTSGRAVPSEWVLLCLRSALLCLGGALLCFVWEVLACLGCAGFCVGGGSGFCLCLRLI